MQSTSFILIKLGGSLITNKHKSHTARKRVIKRLAREVKRALTFDPTLNIIISHGSGSFGHTEAKKYNVIQGFGNGIEPLGACITHYAAASINMIVTECFLEEQVSIASLAPSSMMIFDHNNLSQAFYAPLQTLLDKNIIPLLYGDVVWDKNKGCHIVSGETSLQIIIDYLLAQGHKVDKVLYAGIEDGVYDDSTKKSVIPKITPHTITSLMSHIGASKAVDVTGGMIHKVEEALALAQRGIETVIFNGNKPNLLYNHIISKKYTGTIVSLN